MFEGTYVAVVTPFRGGVLDKTALCVLLDRLVAAGVQGIVPCGTTGESATLTMDEHREVIALTVQRVRGKVKVLAGAGSNNTAEALYLTRAAKEAGADGALLITPYYNKPSQAGLREHFRTIADAVDIPIVLYNVPSRTCVNLLPATVAALAEHPRIVGLKDATGDMNQLVETITLCGDRITILSGDDFTVAPLMMLGGKGVISVVANVVPDRMVALTSAALAGRWSEAARIQRELLRINNAMFLPGEGNPACVKAALARMGLIARELRRPLAWAAESAEKAIEQALVVGGVVNG